MELRHLRYFSVVAEEEHLGRAARRLHVSASPLSRQIKQLEEEAGVRLFERVGRGLRLSEPGRVFLQGARAALAEVERAVQAAQATARGEEGHFSLVFVETRIVSAMIPEIVTRLRALHPKVGLEVSPLSSSEQLEALRTGRADAGLAGQLPAAGSGLKSEALHTEQLLVAMPRVHPLAKVRRLTARSLADEPFIWIPRGMSADIYSELEARLLAAGVRLKVEVEARSSATRLSLVASGMGLTFVPASARPSLPAQVVARPLADLRLELRTHLIWRADREASPVLSSLRRTVRELGPRRGGPALPG